MTRAFRAHLQHGGGEGRKLMWPISWRRGAERLDMKLNIWCGQHRICFQKPVPRLAAMVIGPVWLMAYCRAIRPCLKILLVSMFMVERFVLKTGRACRWSCRFFPTPGRSQIGSIPFAFNSCASPMPESMRICGEPMAPALKITSRRARMVWLWPLILATTPLASPCSTQQFLRPAHG